MSILPTASGTASAGLTSSTAVDRDAFLNLLVLQLKNQDPLYPVDNEAMLAQLAQFSSLEEMQQINAGVQDQVVMTESLNNAIATTLIGKDVKAVGDTLNLSDGEPVTIDYQTGATGPVTVEILDAAGAVVRRIELGATSPGFHTVTWDGRTDGGAAATDGAYRVRVNQQLEDGSSYPANTFVTGQVTGVRFEDGLTYLSVGDRRVLLSDVLEISTPANN
jgi:flagellar basal-body rod modification protein FlgD